MNLVELGWNPFFNQHFEPFGDTGLVPARVACEHRQLYEVYGECGQLAARVSGKLRHKAASRSDFPAVGDWVAIEPHPGEGQATIHATLPRKSKLCRKVAWSRTEEQVVGANVDTVFLVGGLEGDFSLRRLERYLTVVLEGGARPVVLLNKADLCAAAEARAEEARAVAVGVPVHVVSALSGRGMDVLGDYIIAGSTSAMLGSSGVGKSTLINRLVGKDNLRVGAVREHDGRGKHVTTWRELVLIPGGGVIIDTPGMRELQLWADRESLDGTFEDILELARGCRFADCRHATEPGCAVKRAIEEGTLGEDRLRSYTKLTRELAHLAVRRDLRARLDEKSKWKQLSKRIKEHDRHNPKLA
jgi:ribosome biogenesis GTPase / thiamine phosphate phosphatase